MRICSVTLEWWNSVFQFSSAVLLGLTFIAGTGAIITGHFVSQRQARLISTTSERAAAANERASKLELDAAAQQERAATAERKLLELQRQLAWRALTPAQARQLASELGQFPGTRVQFVRYADPEASLFAEQIRTALSEASWSLKIVSVGMGPAVFGVECKHKPEDAAAMAFVRSLRSANIAVTDQLISADPAAWPPGEILGDFQILVGLKPPP
jgi:hypothetical protein